MTAKQCGSIQTVPLGVIADRAARVILEFATARAVTIDPEGRVWVESPRDAAETDIVGCYTRSLGILDLSRAIRDDLLAAKTERGNVRATRRHVVVNRRAA